MRNFRLTLCYDGTDFSGWQTQPEKRTIQQTLEEAIAALTGEERVRVNASGRTDAGVHAIAQVVNFHSATHHFSEVLLRAVNARLPPDLVITSAEEAPPELGALGDPLAMLEPFMTGLKNLYIGRHGSTLLVGTNTDVLAESIAAIDGEAAAACGHHRRRDARSGGPVAADGSPDDNAADLLQLRVS